VANESRRPIGITLLIALVVVYGIAVIVHGITVFSARNDTKFLASNDMTHGELTWLALVAIGIGVFIVLVGLGLGTGSGVARFLVGLFTLVGLAEGVYGIVKYSGSQQTTAILTTILALVVLFLLYGSRRNREFFANN
jgi:hypothetical protein